MAIHSQYVTGRKFVELTHTIVIQEANIFSEYNLCSSIPNEGITVTMASAYILTVLVADLQAFLYEGAYSLYKVVNYGPVAAMASVYDLSTEAP